MRLKFIKEQYLAKFKSITKEEWLKRYSESNGRPWLNNFFNCNHWYDDTGIEISTDMILFPQNATDDKDAENAERIYELFKGKLTPAQATDARFWTYMCHETCWSYMIKRWEIKGDRDIFARYFVQGSGRRAFTRNGIARLWWFAHLTYDETRKDRYELTKVLVKDQNIQHHLLERNFGMNKVILHTMLDMANNNKDIFLKGNIQAAMAKLAKLINRWGGVRLLDCLSKEELIDYVMDRKVIFNG